MTVYRKVAGKQSVRYKIDQRWDDWFFLPEAADLHEQWISNWENSAQKIHTFVFILKTGHEKCYPVECCVSNVFGILSVVASETKEIVYLEKIHDFKPEW